MLGRPPSYTDEIADEICERLANGESMRAICREARMPDRQTVDRWALANKDFAAKRARAREAQADNEHDRIAEIEDGVLDGRIDPQAARVVISSKQWRASKLAPKQYGDRVTQEHVGEGGGPVIVQKITPSDERL
jgi:hypothetical protein